MRALNLDFQPRPRSGPLGWSLLGGGVLLALLCFGVQQHLDAHTEQQQGHLQTTQRQLTGDSGAKSTLSPAETREQAANLAEMRKVSQQLRRPWERLFAMLEAMPRDDVALLSLTRMRAKARSASAPKRAICKRCSISTNVWKPATSCPTCRC